MSARPPAVCTAAISADTANAKRQADEHLDDHQAGHAQRVGGDVLAVHGDAA